ncbi:aspartate-semialdehyde dehydrogenase [bacterium]|nr:aspartate-semialdehyde dehydrogenase [bacterium]
MKAVAVVGATGAVGKEIIGCLEQSRIQVGQIRLYASDRSAGKKMTYRGGEVELETLSDDAFRGVDVALFASEADISGRYAPIAVKAGAFVVDNSSAFRMDPGTPLVVPEINGALVTPDTRLVANPNCVAAILTMALFPLHLEARVNRVWAATYQAASGAGAAAVEELELSTRAFLDGKAYPPKVLPHPYAFNLFSHNASIDPATGYNGEELKVIAETRRIMDLPGLPISITAVRVPVQRTHAIAASVAFDRPITEARAREVLSQFPGLRLVDDRAANHFPMPVEASGKSDVLVGRIRTDLGDPSGRTLAIFIAGDQLLKGAALNAVQIAELAA